MRVRRARFLWSDRFLNIFRRSVVTVVTCVLLDGLCPQRSNGDIGRKDIRKRSLPAR